MRIGVVSDTHSKSIPRIVVDDFKKVDFIIHTGDFCTLRDLEFFSRIKEVKGVCGNMDDRQLRSILPKQLFIEVEGVIVGIAHGGGAHSNILNFIRKEFKDKKTDVIVFGHSHHPMNEYIGSTLYFNPGSCTDTIFAPYRSYGILEINNGKVQSKIIRIEEE